MEYEIKYNVGSDKSENNRNDEKNNKDKDFDVSILKRC